MSPDAFSHNMLTWFDQDGRHDLPWQQVRDAYRIWVAEIMLQQTQVKTVIPYFERFITRFPDAATLATAGLDEVLHLWTGLGYYARARNLHRAAQLIISDHRGALPRDISQLQRLPGIGRSTAGAILAQAYDERHPILDGNVKRVLTRFHAIAGWPGASAVERQLWTLAERYTPVRRCADYTQAIMDLGATLCSRSRPACDRCPLAAGCEARRLGRQADYPAPKPRATLPVRSTRMLLLTDAGGRVLLEQRPPAGLWGGLWSLPECPLEQDVASWCRKQLRCVIGESYEGERLRHSFSHFHLDIHPTYARVLREDLGVMEAGGRVWYNSRQPDARGLSAPVKRLLANLPLTPPLESHDS